MDGRMIAFAAVAWAATASAAQAATVLISNWDDTPAGLSVVNLTSGIASWTGAPQIDIVNDNTFGLRCAGATGRCADLAGSPGAIGGTLTSSILTATASAVNVQFLYSGAQRGRAGALFLAELINASTNSVVASWASPALPATVAFNTGNLSGDVGPARQFQVRFTHLGGTGNQNIGAVVDDVSFSSVIPEPSTRMLMIMGFGLIATQLRRRHRVALAA